MTNEPRRSGLPGFQPSRRFRGSHCVAAKPLLVKPNLSDYLGFEFLPVQNKRGPTRGPLFIWRRGRDSNPRYAQTYTHFPGVLLQPLGHLSRFWRRKGKLDSGAKQFTRGNYRLFAPISQPATCIPGRSGKKGCTDRECPRIKLKPATVSNCAL